MMKLHLTVTHYWEEHVQQETICYHFGEEDSFLPCIDVGFLLSDEGFPYLKEFDGIEISRDRSVIKYILEDDVDCGYDDCDAVFLSWDDLRDEYTNFKEDNK